jgi:hypothetical protein
MDILELIMVLERPTRQNGCTINEYHVTERGFAEARPELARFKI